MEFSAVVGASSTGISSPLSSLSVEFQRERFPRDKRIPSSNYPEARHLLGRRHRAGANRRRCLGNKRVRDSTDAYPEHRDVTKLLVRVVRRRKRDLGFLPRAATRRLDEAISRGVASNNRPTADVLSVAECGCTAYRVRATGNEPAGWRYQ